MAEYYYLISSLPSLHADAEPAIRLAEFLEQCAEWITHEELSVLTALDLIPKADDNTDEESQHHDTAAAWNDWETCLRNAIARHRGASGQDIETALRHEIDCYAEIESGVQEAWSQTDPLEREKVLFRLRWNYLDSLEGGHHFDFQLLCVYKLKLRLLERQQEFNAAAGRSNFDQTVGKIEHRES